MKVKTILNLTNLDFRQALSFGGLLKNYGDHGESSSAGWASRMFHWRSDVIKRRTSAIMYNSKDQKHDSNA